MSHVHWQGIMWRYLNTRVISCDQIRLTKQGMDVTESTWFHKLWFDQVLRFFRLHIYLLFEWGVLSVILCMRAWLMCVIDFVPSNKVIPYQCLCIKQLFKWAVLSHTYFDRILAEFIDSTHFGLDILIGYLIFHMVNNRGSNIAYKMSPVICLRT